MTTASIGTCSPTPIIAGCRRCCAISTTRTDRSRRCTSWIASRKGSSGSSPVMPSAAFSYTCAVDAAPMRSPLPRATLPPCRERRIESASRSPAFMSSVSIPIPSSMAAAMLATGRCHGEPDPMAWPALLDRPDLAAAGDDPARAAPGLNSDPLWQAMSNAKPLPGRKLRPQEPRARPAAPRCRGRRGIARDSGEDAIPLDSWHFSVDRARPQRSSI
jgi:hypothetical protein